MKQAFLLLSFVVFQTHVFGAAPTIGGVVNSASNNDAALPNGGIAQGAIFTIFGLNMGPSTLTFGDLPRPLALSSTVVTVTSGSFTAAAPLIYTSANQVAAIMPSATPVGNARLSVTYAGSTSTSSIVSVVSSNVGLFAVSQDGAGAAVVDFADYSLVTPTKSAKAGDTLILWGTGLGAISGDDAQGAAGGNLPTQVQVFVGGAPATVVYHGRSPGSTGLDQINFVVPSGVLGCTVSLVVRAGNLVSNNTVISVSANGGVCTDPAGFPNLQTQLSKSNVTLAALLLDNEVSAIPQNGSTGTTTSTKAKAYFLKFTQAQFASQYLGFFTIASPGSCLTKINRDSGGGGGNGPAATYLDAGTSLGLTSSSNQTLPFSLQQQGVYSASPNGFQAGAYTFSNGSGGADIRAFSQTATIASNLTWTNQSIAASPIDRTLGLTITWTGGDPSAYVQVDASAGVQNSGTLGTDVICTAPVSANQLTIPASVLLALPPNGGGALTISEVSAQSLAIPNADVGLAVVTQGQAIPAQFK